MKKIFLTIALLSTSLTSVFAQEKVLEEKKPLNVYVFVNAEDKVLQIRFYETEDSSSTCYMDNSAVSIQAPSSSPLYPSPVGSIAFETFFSPGVICMTAFGFNYGMTSIKLDDIQSGSFALTIDGVSYGYIQVDGDTAELVPTIKVLF